MSASSDFVDYRRFEPQPVIGVDEAGRGCLAGPVFASAVILSFSERFWDSKALTPEKKGRSGKNHQIPPPLQLRMRRCGGD